MERLEVKESYKIVDEEVSPIYDEVPLKCDDVRSIMTTINPIFNDSTLLRQFSGRAYIGSFCLRIGATSTVDSPYISVINDDESSVHSEELDEDKLLNNLYDDI